MLLAARDRCATDVEEQPLVKLMKLPLEQGQQCSRSKEVAAKVTDVVDTEVTETFAIDGDALQQWVWAALPARTKELEVMGVQVSERKGVKGRRYLVVTGSHTAVEKASLSLEAFLEDARAAVAESGRCKAAECDSVRKMILAMLKPVGASRMMSPTDAESFSKDELLVCAMEAREDAEVGADIFNSETFGETCGWSHEENVAANRALKISAEMDPPLEPSANDSSNQLAPPPGLANRPSPPPVPPPRGQRPSSTVQFDGSSQLTTPSDLSVSPSPQIPQSPTPATKPLQAVLPRSTRSAVSAQKAHAKRVCKSSKEDKLADPLPQRNAAPRPPLRMLSAGLVLSSDSRANAASGPRWAQPPVKQLVIGHSSEEEDPDLACYIWDRRRNRSQALIETWSRASPKWGIMS